MYSKLLILLCTSFTIGTAQVFINIPCRSVNNNETYYPSRITYNGSFDKVGGFLLRIGDFFKNQQLSSCDALNQLAVNGSDSEIAFNDKPCSLGDCFYNNQISTTSNIASTSVIKISTEMSSSTAQSDTVKTTVSSSDRTTSQQAEPTFNFISSSISVDGTSLSSDDSSTLHILPSSDSAQQSSRPPVSTSTSSSTGFPMPTITRPPMIDGFFTDNSTIRNASLYANLLNSLFGQETSDLEIEEKEFMNIGNNINQILEELENEEFDKTNLNSLATTILQGMDQLALSLNVMPGGTTLLNFGSFELQVRRVTGEESGGVVGISTESGMIALPEEIFLNRSDTRLASFLYKSITNLLTDSAYEVAIKTILSSTTTFNVTNLTDPVNITFNRNESDSRTPVCAFWDLYSNNGNGGWSTEGCELYRFNDTVIHCQCFHLTHFAVLFDVTGQSSNVGETDEIVLTWITYIGFSISGVCIILTVLILILLKSLWGLRHYIHIHLCINLFAAQLLTIIGIDKSMPFEKNDAGCAALAVILQFLHCVVFMWMMMEGVVLYIKLVRVFDDNDKVYFILFTILCYGLPLVYLFLTVPLGLARGTSWSYGSSTLCWLTYDDYFILAFIIPVVLIILVNCIFLVIVMVIVTNKLRKDPDSKVKRIRTWMRSAFSLIIILGIGWLLGLFVFHVVLIYVTALFYAFQGLMLFILFILMSSQVRQAISKKGKYLSTHLSSYSFASTSGSNKKNAANNKKSAPKKGSSIEMGTFVKADTLEKSLNSIEDLTKESTADIVDNFVNEDMSNTLETQECEITFD